MGLKLWISNGDIWKFLRIFRVCPLEEQKAKSHLFPLKMKGSHLSASFGEVRSLLPNRFENYLTRAVKNGPQIRVFPSKGKMGCVGFLVNSGLHQGVLI